MVLNQLCALTYLALTRVFCSHGLAKVARAPLYSDHQRITPNILKSHIDGVPGPHEIDLPLAQISRPDQTPFEQDAVMLLEVGVPGHSLHRYPKAFAILHP